MNFRPKKESDDSINLTPLIDVVFLLLIFFMVSTTFTKEQHLQLDLPEAVTGERETQQDSLEILIAADGSYSVDGQQLVNRKLRTLHSALKAISEENSDVPLIITADAKTPHEAVVSAMDIASQLGVLQTAYYHASTGLGSALVLVASSC